jgi:hypothetical protein
MVRSNCGKSAKSIIRAIFTDLDSFNIEPFDDQTLIAMKVK